jgi:hypothetical protein
LVYLVDVLIWGALLSGARMHGVLHEFSAGDDSHPETQNIHKMMIF